MFKINSQKCLTRTLIVTLRLPAHGLRRYLGKKVAAPVQTQRTVFWEIGV